MTVGHLFVSRGDLLNFACDAWLLPTDASLNVTPFWHSVPNLLERLDAVQDERFSTGEIVALPLEPVEGEATPVLTAVPPTSITGPDDAAGYEEVARRLAEFVAVASVVAREHPVTKRPLPLIAVPVFATAGGGSGEVRDALLTQQLRVLRELAVQFEVDIVIVTRRDDVHAFAQSRRRRDAAGSWPELTAGMLADVESLAVRARARRLVPFLGAGTSVSAGGPTWSALLADLGRKAGLDEVTTMLLRSKNVLDQASYLNTLYEAGEEGSFAEAVADQIRTLTRYGLAPALLTAIGSEQAITLNYDTLFEKASKDAGVPRSVIPGAHEGEHQRWLLKLHGTVEDPSSIVLTRDDYLGFNASRQTLSAIVKATLATRHLLFVGFGLEDDHFHEIVHDVRRAFPDTAAGTRATALTLFDDPLDRQLWRGKMRLIPMLCVPHDEDRVGEAARLLEIFLDALSAHATDAYSYLLAEGHTSALTPAELQLRNRLTVFLDTVTEEERATGAWAPIAEALARLGGPESKPR